MSNRQFASIAKLFYIAQINYPLGMDYVMSGPYLNALISDIMKAKRLSHQNMIDILMIFHKRAIMKVEMENVNGTMTVVTLRAGSNALDFIQSNEEFARAQRWTRALSIVALVVSVLALGAQIGASLGWISPP